MNPSDVPITPEAGLPCTDCGAVTAHQLLITMKRKGGWVVRWVRCTVCREHRVERYNGRPWRRA